MQLLRSLFLLVNLAILINALALPTSFDAALESSKDLFKRKGGGGGGGRGGGGGSSSSSSGGSRGSGSSSSGSSSSGRTSSTSQTGGSTRAGSGTARGYGGGAYYGGGAAVPYRSGSPSGRSVAPYFIGGAALGILPGVWLYGAYAYSYPGYYHYYNTSANRNESHPIECLCGARAECGCDPQNSTDYLNDVANNNTMARLADVNGTQTLVINGTLENGTTAPGGSDSAASGFKHGFLESSGIWVVVSGVIYTMYFM